MPRPMPPLKTRAIYTGLAVLLSFGVLFNTLLVTVHNLGAREDIGYINGGKVFRQTGTMWYHIPGLQELGLAPQNIGARINLRNNEFAKLERELRAVSTIDVDFSLAKGAILLIILDRHSEGSFWAVRLTAIDKAHSPFVNALIRFEHGQVITRIPLGDLGRSLTPGPHHATVALTGQGQLVTTVDQARQALPFDVIGLHPKLALGCGELNTTITRWAVTGVDKDGHPFDWVEEFSIARTLDRRFSPILFLSALLWLLLLGGPALKVMLESRQGPLTIFPRILLHPKPRWIFGLFCLVPVTPMVLQWIGGGMYIMYAHMSLWEAWAGGRRTWAVTSATSHSPLMPNRARRGWLIIAALLLGAAVALFALSSTRRWAQLGQTDPASRGTPITSAAGMQRLSLGQRLTLDFVGQTSDATRVELGLTLAAGQVARLDLLRELPPTTSDVYQVDRSSDVADNDPSLGFGPGGGEERDDRGPDHDRAPDRDNHSEGPSDAQRSQNGPRPGSNGPQDPSSGPQGQEGPDQGGHSDFELRALSTLLSTDPELPGQLRWLHSDKYERSPHMGWMLTPGKHHVAVTVAPPLCVVSVDGVVVDMRTDVNYRFRPGAIQVLSLSNTVQAVGELRVLASNTDALAQVWSDRATALLLLIPALLLLVLGLVAAAFAVLGTVKSDAKTIARAALKILRAASLLLLWLLYWLAEQLDWVDWAGERTQIWAAAFAILFLTINVAQILRQSDLTRPRWRRLVGPLLILVLALGTFEGVSRLYPERRFEWTHYWNYKLGPRYLFVADPMIRRLNPWFIDQRFKRRDWTPEHPGKLRVVVFGGSQTYGWGIPAMDRMTFSDQLERALHAGGYPQTEVLNAAFPGVKTGTGLRWFASNLLRYQPDIVVINFVVNEFMNVDQFHVWSGERQNDAPISQSTFLSLLERWRGDAMGNHLSQIIVANVYEIYEMRSYLRWWVDIARAHGIKVVFSIEPTNLYVESGGDTIMRQELGVNGDAQALYRALGKALDVPVYDVLPFFAENQENMWFYDTMHMSRLGHRVFAEHLADLIIQRILAPKDAPPNDASPKDAPSEDTAAPPASP